MLRNTKISNNAFAMIHFSLSEDGDSSAIYITVSIYYSFCVELTLPSSMQQNIFYLFGMHVNYLLLGVLLGGS